MKLEYKMCVYVCVCGMKLLRSVIHYIEWLAYNMYKSYPVWSKLHYGSWKMIHHYLLTFDLFLEKKKKIIHLQPPKISQ